MAVFLARDVLGLGLIILQLWICIRGSDLFLLAWQLVQKVIENHHHGLGALWGPQHGVLLLARGRALQPNSSVASPWLKLLRQARDW